jgi:hypothetical protein
VADMLGDDPADWTGATFQRSGGAEWRRILVVDGRAPVQVGLPLDDEWLEEFRIDEWRDGEPVYRSIGFVPRDRPEEGM